MFLKRRDEFQRTDVDITQAAESVFSGLTLEDLAAGRLPRQRTSQLAPTAEHVPNAHRGALPEPFDPELDGTCVLAFVDQGQVHLRSHEGDGQAYEDRYPDVVRALAAQPVERAIFVGEVVADAEYSVCDLLYLDGYDLRRVAPAERKKLLHAVLAPLGGLSPA